MLRLLLFYTLFVLFILGCQPAAVREAPVAAVTTEAATAAPTALPSPTPLPPSPTPVATDVPATLTPVPTATATNAPEATATPTATATQTQAPTATATKAPPTVVPQAPTQQPTVTQQATATGSQARVNRLELSADYATLYWDVSGVQQVTIRRTGGQFGEADASYTLDARGDLQQSFPDGVAGWPVFYELTSADAPALSQRLEVQIPCSVVADPDYYSATCPLDRSLNGAQQNFERGLMVWIEPLDLIYWTTYTGLENDVVQDSFVHGVDPVDLDSITPPDGYLQPQHGFGKVWRSSAAIREALGWAIAAPANYAMQVYIDPGDPRYGTGEQRIALQDGSIEIKGRDPIWSVRSNNTPTNNAPYPPPATIGESAQPTGVNVISFGFDRRPQRPSDQVTLRWQISGVETIHVERFGGEWGQANAGFDLAAQGELAQQFPVDVGGWSIQYVVTSKEAPDFEHYYEVELPCEYEWVIAAGESQLACPTQPIVSAGAQQNFENGFMIWIADQDVIIWSTWNGLSNGIVPDDYVQGVDPVRDPSITPPAGRYQPEYGFGKVWREQQGVRDLLGWGTDWGSDYTVRRQATPAHRYGNVEYITMRDGGLITIDGSPIWNVAP